MVTALRFLLLALVAVTFAACSQGAEKQSHNHKGIPDLPPDAPGAMVREALKKQKLMQLEFDFEPRPEVTSLDSAIKLGERNLDWLKHINSKSQAGVVLSFSSKETMTGYPMDKPNRYSDKIALARYNQAVKDMPPEMYNVLIKGEPFTDQPPIDLKAYLAWGLKIDKVYQTAARWQMMQPYLSYLANRRAEDVRGFYFLSVEPDLKNKLESFAALSADDRARLERWLVLLCFNAERMETVCKAKFLSAKTDGKLWALYETYNLKGKKLFDSYFNITSKRTDIVWNDSVLVYPFRDPKNDPVETYLKFNIEEEWKWKGWSLVLKFTPDAATHVEFVAGTTPHVDGLAGSKITMDANAPLTEWDVQWTIRHEFGHNLGFPDCYIEFYEPGAQEIVNYQIDTSNLMCSRMGVLQQKHYDELKEAY